MKLKRKMIINLWVIFLVILILNLTSAQISQEDKEKLENVTENIKKISDKDFKNEFLKQEWTYFLNKTSFGRAIITINDGIKIFNPFWNLVLGVNYSFSWGFWIAITIWLILFFIFLPPSEIVLKTKPFAILASFSITSIIGLSGVIRKTTDLIGTIMNNKVTALMIFLFSMVLLVLAKKSNKIWKQLKEKEAKRKEEQSRQILYTDAEAIKKKTKKSSFND